MFYTWQCNDRQIVHGTREDIEWLQYVADAYASTPIALTLRDGYFFLMLPRPTFRPD